MGSSALLTTLRVLTFVTAIGVGLSPFPEIYRVHKQRTVGQVSIFPIVTLFGNSYLWMIYSYLVGNFFPLFSVTAFQAVTALFFAAVFFWWSTTERPNFYKQWGILAIGLAIITVYAIIAMAGVTHESEHEVTTILGYLCVAMNLMLKVAPLETIKHIVQTKNASSMPVTMSIVAFVNGALWVWTSAITGDMFVLVPNAIGGALGSVQVIVYVIYRPGKARTVPTSSTPLASGEHESSSRQKSDRVVYDVDQPRSSKGEQTKSPVYIAARSPV